LGGSGQLDGRRKHQTPPEPGAGRDDHGIDVELGGQSDNLGVGATEALDQDYVYGTFGRLARDLAPQGGDRLDMQVPHLADSLRRHGKRADGVHVEHYHLEALPTGRADSVRDSPQ
jgi:hypothetical protein